MALTPEAIAKLQTQIQALNDAIAAGVRSVTLGGQTVTYNTTDSLIAARNDLQGQLNEAVIGPRARQHQAVYAGRGY